MCRECQRRTSVTAGTIFHRTRSPLTTWFAAIWWVTAQKNGMSAQTLQRSLGLGSYETAWAWLHKLRRAMVRPDRDQLHGSVEVGETLVQGVSGASSGLSGKLSGRAVVMVAAERPGPGKTLGRIRLGHADRVGGTGLANFARNAVAPGSTIITDREIVQREIGQRNGDRSIEVRLKRPRAPKTVGGEMVGGSAPRTPQAARAPQRTSILPGSHLPSAQMASRHLSAWLTGTLHHGVAAHHLPYYLDEFTFRFNRRSADSRGLLFYRLLQQAVHTDPAELDEILDAEHSPFNLSS